MIDCNPIIVVGQQCGTIAMGVVGNFNARTQTFDIGPWRRALGDGQLVVSLRRPGDETPYAVANVTVDGDTAVWTFDDVDTAQSGYGVVFLTYRSGDSFSDATADIPCYIGTNSAPDGPVPSGLESWYQDMLAATAAAQAAQDAAEDAQAAAESAYTQAVDAKDDAAGSAQAAATSAEQASSSAAQAVASAEAAEQSALSMAFVSFGLDPSTGDLLMYNPHLLGTTNFALNSEGNLEVTI